MSAQLEELVAQLEAIDLEQHLDEPARLESAFEERQSLLTAIQDTDTSSLTDEVRADLRSRLEAVLTRDHALVADIQELMSETHKALEQLTPGRAAVRGYEQFSSTLPPGIKRIG